MRNQLNTKLPEKVKIQTCYTGRRLSSRIRIKGKTKKEHGPEELCGDSYIGESSRRLVERVKDHNGRDNKSHVLKHSMEKRHTNVEYNEFKIIGRHCKNNKRKKEKCLKHCESNNTHEY